MCFKVDGKFRTRALAQQHVKEPLIAKKNIVVYKVLEKSTTLISKKTKREYLFISPHRCTTYKPGEIKAVEKFTFRYVDVCGWRAEINKGLHSYKDNLSCVREFHQISKSYPRKILVKCIIPKGTPYYKNKDEYVSLKLEMPEEFIDHWRSKKNEA